MKNRDNTYDMSEYYDSEYNSEYDIDDCDEPNFSEDYSQDENENVSAGDYDEELDELEDAYSDEEFDDEEVSDDAFSEMVEKTTKKVETNHMPKKNVGRYASEKNAELIKKNGTSGTDVRSRFVEIVNDYNSDNVYLKQAAAERAIKELEGFIHTIIKRSYSTYSREYFKDLLQEGRLGVLVGLQKYDPQKSMPTTFFYPYIKHEMQSLITKQVDKTTTHYSTNIKKINKVIEEFDERGQPYSNVDIAIQTGMTIETVNQSMAIRNYRDEIHIDSCPPGSLDDKQKSSKIQTPEEAYFEEEEREMIYRAINKYLNDMEIKVLEMHFGINNVETCSEGEIAKKLDIPKDKVKKLLNGAIRKLKNSELRNSFKDNLISDNLLVQEKEISFVNTELAEQDIGFLLDAENL